MLRKAASTSFADPVETLKELHDGAGNTAVDEFVGGTVYQAFLRATNYHRWHSPVAATVARAFVQKATFHSEPDSLGAEAADPTTAQAYLAYVAARDRLIEADHPSIGLLDFVGIGMSEVSSCVIDSHFTPGYHLEKGEELGCFQFGGSTECLIFRPGALADFTLTAIPHPHRTNAQLVCVRSALATANAT